MTRLLTKYTRDYHTDYNYRSCNFISFMSSVTITSDRLQCEIVLISFVQTHWKTSFRSSSCHMINFVFMHNTTSSVSVTLFFTPFSRGCPSRPRQGPWLLSDCHQTEYPRCSVTSVPSTVILRFFFRTVPKKKIVKDTLCLDIRHSRVTRGLRTGGPQKFESIRINLSDLDPD